MNLAQPSAIDDMSRSINSVAVRHESFGVSRESAHLSGIWSFGATSCSILAGAHIGALPLERWSVSAFAGLGLFDW